MGKKTISLDYGTYDNFGYKKDATTFELTWDAPDGLEAKYEKAFDDNVETALDKMEKDLSSGTSEAKKWLANMDKQLSTIFKNWEKNGTASKKDVELCDGLQAILPDMIESLEKQRVKVFESMLDKILDGAVAAIAAKFKQKITSAKIKKGLKIVAFAVIALTVTAIGVVAAIASFGVAVGPILGVIGLIIGGLSTGVGVVSKAKTIWGSGKDEAKTLESSAKAYAEATSAFDEVLKRQVSVLAARAAQVDVIDKQIAETRKQLLRLDGLKKNVGDKVQDSIDKAMKELVALQKSYEELDAELKQLEKLVDAASSKKTYEAAMSLAATLKADRGILDKINDHGGNLGGLLGNIGSALS